MILEQRVFYQAVDISTKVNDYRLGAHTFPYQTGQHLYIGSILPFNNIFIELGTLNIVPANVSVDIWWGQEWNPAVDVIDETLGLTATGRIQWNTDYQKGWDRELFSKDVDGLPSTSAIYDMYWVRFSWDANLTAGTTIKYIGQKFANDDILYSFYPDLNNQTIKDSYEQTSPTGTKIDWNEQHYMAAEHIVRDLKKSNIIKARGQILDYSLFIDASCHKVAELVYTAFGRPYLDQLELARNAYKESKNLKFFNVDANGDGTLNRQERVLTTTFGRR